MDAYQVFEKVGEGSYGVVKRGVKRRVDGVVDLTDPSARVALKYIRWKCMAEGIPISVVREIKALKLLSAHPNIVALRDIAHAPAGEAIVDDDGLGSDLDTRFTTLCFANLHAPQRKTAGTAAASASSSSTCPMTSSAS
jgi:serine/threonine protein kinase